MIVCDRCKKNAARIFSYGDAINNALEYTDLCYDCTKEINEIIWKFRKGQRIEIEGVKV